MEGVHSSLSEDDLIDLADHAKDYAISNGVVVRTVTNPENGEVVNHAPFTLLPSPVPKTCFDVACQVQTDFNLLMHKVAHDYEFLHDCLKFTIKVDDFTRRLWNIYETIRSEGISQPVSLGLNRSDYMLDCRQPADQVLASGEPLNLDTIHIKQIEFNTIASSFGGLSCQMAKTHRYMLNVLRSFDKVDKLPPNAATEGLAEGMVKAWEQYGNEKAVILFLVFSVERNLYDQRWLEYGVKTLNPKVTVIRRSIQDIARDATLAEDKSLHVGGHEIAVVYMRSGYTPVDYKDEQDWQGRLLMERSRAIKCPNVYYQLAGTKKVQQVLARKGVLERFLDDSVAIRRIRATFAGQYSLDMGEEGDKAVAMAMENPDKFVLKPQREGGGNNIYGHAICDKLKAIQNSEERSAYILMDRIYPAPLRNYPVRISHPIQLAEMVSELGIFGIVIGTSKRIILNKQQGHILRTKISGTDEGGVATGYAVLDSPFLI